MDLTFRMEQGTFNYRVCAIITQNQKLLAMKDERSPYFYLPGGRVNLHETAEDAVLREIKEELGIDGTIVRPLWFNQNFFTEEVNQQRYHELCFYFLIDVSHTDLDTKGNSFILTEGHKFLTFEWLEFSELSSTYLYPNFIKEHIFNLPTSLTMITEFK